MRNGKIARSRLASVLLLTVCTFILAWGWGSEKPSNSDFQKQFELQLPAYFELQSFKVDAIEDLGTQAAADVRAKFSAVLKLKTSTFEADGKDGDILFLRHVAKTGDTKEAYGRVQARKQGEKWNITYSLETNPVETGGKPRDSFPGAKVILRGSEEEKKFLADKQAKQEEAKRLADEKAAKAEAEKQAAAEKAAAAETQKRAEAAQAEASARVEKARLNAEEAQRRVEEQKLVDLARKYNALAGAKHVDCRKMVGNANYFLLTGATSGARILGTDIYSTNSDLTVVAVHAGVLRSGERGLVRVTCQGPRRSFIGSTRNGIKSDDETTARGNLDLDSFTIERVRDVGGAASAPSTPLQSQADRVGPAVGQGRESREASRSEETAPRAGLWVVTKDVHLGENPGLLGAGLGILQGKSSIAVKAGTKVDVIDENGSNKKVRLPGGEVGWLNGYYLKKSE